MTAKRVKNEQWSLKELISKINNEEISKPKFQRKKKWDVLQKKNSNPNEYSYIKFLYDTENSVHAITFGQESNSKGVIYSNIDGNNRINAIKHFIDRPFDIFSDYLDNLFKVLDNINSKNILEIKEIFNSLSYDEIINIKTPAKFFRNINKYQLFEEIQGKQNEIDDHIEIIQKKLKVNGIDNFDINVKINVNLFEGYNTDELCKTFEAINRYNSKLTETELLACRLHNDSNFIIKDKKIETELKESIQKYYKDKSKDEVLNCFEYTDEQDINAHDFIVGFQNLCSEKYKFICKDDIQSLSLFYKLYKSLHGSFIETFTTKNVNKFIEKINYSCDILQKTISNIFTDKINSRLFNKTCQYKLDTLKKNNLVMLISSIIGFKKKKVSETEIIKNLEKCLIYHFFVSDLKNKDIKEKFQNKDSITYRHGGGFIEIATKDLLINPENISNKLDENLFINLITGLFNETKLPHKRKLDNGKNKNDKRRNLKFFEKTLMFYYYKGKIPTIMLDNEFSIEHIIPNSSSWEGELDKDRTGNLIPIISTINCSRQNKHIDAYKETKGGKEFFNFIKDIIPLNVDYNNIVAHENRKPIITDNEKYNEMCDKNEEIYFQNLIESLF
jgi:hypothetical protein